MTIDNQNTLFKLAFDFVNDTNCPIYLTGKAGTGKTTFLKYVKQHCTKKLIVVAPTGVAAINAGGVTMHSFFQLPFGPYIANMPRGFGLNDQVANRNSMLKNMRLSNIKRKIIEDLELLIIDEVSMLRCDMLDAIDTILRSVRRSNLPFGGVQVLFIGDLYQLPPVVINSEKELLDEHYKSPFFFHANVFDETKPVFIELKKIYRQNEQSFIDLLNNLRNNYLTQQDFDQLEERYQPLFHDKSNRYITLTSHNYKADTINKEELDRLKTPLHEFKGQIIDDFGDKQLPTEMVLRLKEGAQVMFIKNDSSPEKKYYNGKIVTVTKIEDQTITVTFSDTKETHKVSRETWDNISYTVNSESGEIEEKIVGQFIQFPLRLAWAITIHKSQGLTFEHAIIDAGESFAAGQVYVALSRCTSLQGVVLHSRISSRSIHSDPRIYDFNMNERSDKELSLLLQEQRFHYQTQRLFHLFNWKKVLDAVYVFHQETMQCKYLPDEKEASVFCKDLIEKTRNQLDVAEKFTTQLQSLFNDLAFSQNAKPLIERARKAIEFFTRSMHNDLLLPLQDYASTIQANTKLKKYVLQVKEFEAFVWTKIDALQKSSFDGHLLAEGLPLYSFEKQALIKPAKKVKGDSAKETYAYFMAGKSISEIAKLRNLAISTIESHLAEMVKKGELDIFQLLTLEQLEDIHTIHLESKVTTTKELKEILNDAYSYAFINMALDYFSKETT